MTETTTTTTATITTAAAPIHYHVAGVGLGWEHFVYDGYFLDPGDVVNKAYEPTHSMPTMN
ncbi:MAG: hypothetical protein OXF41_09830 [bacterium]|nr:hypothetical protein [bacterium]